MSASRQTVLLVEDRPEDVLLLQRVLKRANVSGPVQVVSNGEESMAYLEGREPYADRDCFPLPNIVFLDLKLPGISGFEVLAWIRQQPRFNRIRVVVLTGSRHTIDVYRAYELGADSFVAKPINLSELEQALKTSHLNWPGFAHRGEVRVGSPPVVTPSLSSAA